MPEPSAALTRHLSGLLLCSISCVQGFGAMVRSLLQQVVQQFRELGLTTPSLEYAAGVLADPRQTAPDRER